MRRELVSVIITTYNRENFVKYAIESVLQSSYQNFELLIVDDCSTDNTVSIIKQYKDNPKVKIFINENNLGQFENRNYAATLANGKYIKYLDSDDTIYKYGLETMVDIIERYPGAGIAVSHDLPNENIPYPIYLSSKDAYQCEFISNGFPHSGPSATIINRDAFNQIGGFPQPYYVGTDSIFLLKMAANFPIIKMQPNLIWYRQHADQAIIKGNNSNEYLENNLSQFYNLLIEKKCPLNEKEKSDAFKKLKTNFIKNIINLAIKNRAPFQALKILRKNYSLLKSTVN